MKKPLLIVLAVLLVPMLLAALLVLLIPERGRPIARPPVPTWMPTVVPEDKDSKGFESIVAGYDYADFFWDGALVDAAEFDENGNIKMFHGSPFRLAVPLSWAPCELRYEIIATNGFPQSQQLACRSGIVDSEETFKTGELNARSAGSTSFLTSTSGLYFRGTLDIRPLASTPGRRGEPDVKHLMYAVNSNVVQSGFSEGVNLGDGCFAASENGYYFVELSSPQNLLIVNPRIRRLPKIEVEPLDTTPDADRRYLTPEEQQAGWLQLSNNLYTGGPQVTPGRSPLQYHGITTLPIGCDAELFLAPVFPQYELRFDYRGTNVDSRYGVANFQLRGALSSNHHRTTGHNLSPVEKFRTMEVVKTAEGFRMGQDDSDSRYVEDYTTDADLQNWRKTTQDITFEKLPGGVLDLRRMRVLPLGLEPVLEDKLDENGVLVLREGEPGIELPTHGKGVLFQCEARARTESADVRLRWRGNSAFTFPLDTVYGADREQRDGWTTLTGVLQYTDTVFIMAAWADGRMYHVNTLPDPARSGVSGSGAFDVLQSEKGEMELRNMKAMSLE